MWDHPRTDKADNAAHDARLLKCQIIVCVVFSKMSTLRIKLQKSTNDNN